MLLFFSLVFIVCVLVVVKQKQSSLTQDPCLKEWVGRRVHFASKQKQRSGELYIHGSAVELLDSSEENAPRSVVFYEDELSQYEVYLFHDELRSLDKDLPERIQNSHKNRKSAKKSFCLYKKAIDSDILEHYEHQKVLLETAFSGEVFTRIGILSGYSRRYLGLQDVLISEEENVFLNKAKHDWVQCEIAGGVLKIKNKLDEDLGIIKLEGLDFRRDIHAKLTARMSLEISVDQKKVNDLVLRVLRHRMADVLVPRSSSRIRKLNPDSDQDQMGIPLSINEQGSQKEGEEGTAAATPFGPHQLFT